MLQRQSPEQVLLYKRVAACVEGFAPLPAVAMRVLDLVTDSDTTVDDLEEVMQGDVSLVVAVLKLANSAFYGLRRQVGSLKHALTLLGKSEVQNLILVKVLFRSFKASDSHQQIVMTTIWRHSLECAIAVECVGEQAGEENPLFFLAGMLHDIGRVLIVSEFFEEIEDVESYGNPGSIVHKDIEEGIFGCSHDKLGSQLLFRWMFPTELVDVIAEHHDYGTIAEKGHVSKVLILANLLTCKVTLEDWDHLETNREKELADVKVLLGTCGKESGLLPDDESLEKAEALYRQRLAERAELLELMVAG